MTDTRIEVAKPSDSLAIIQFITLHFSPSEPIQSFHIDKDVTLKLPPELLLKECLESEATLLAYEGDELIGVLLAGEISANISDQDLEYGKEYGAKGIDVFTLLSYIGEKADICNHLKVPKCLHFHILSVHSGHLRKGIASKLFKFGIDIGREKNYPAFSVDCTSAFTSKIAEKFEMNLISTVNYDEYNKHVGKVLFYPDEIHDEIRSYAKVYAH